MFPRVNEIPFDSERKLMTTLNTVGNKTIAYTKGAIDSLLEKCTHILENGKKRKITKKDIDKINETNTNFASRALRVLAYAYKEVTGDVYKIDKNIESELTFIGLTGMIDPPREEVFDAIKTCKEAGITTLMITGDHKDTAFAIARDLKIAEDISQVITGKELDLLSEEEFKDAIKNFRVFARVNPEHKVKIVKALKQQDLIVAMTGDGVNDAPSIKNADIGIGMGITGTDVTKEVADVILTDDNFATIVEAVKEGRKIYSNILKTIIYMLATGFAELLMLFTVMVIFGRDFFTPALILVLNFITDTLPAIALGLEKSEPNVMKRKPHNTRGHLLSGHVGINIIVYGIVQAALVLGVYFIGIYGYNLSNTIATTMAFVTMVGLEAFHAYNLKNETASIFKSQPFNNKLLNISTLCSLVLTIPFVVLPLTPIQNALGITTLSAVQLLICLGVSLMIIPIAELVKFFLRLKMEK